MNELRCGGMVVVNGRKADPRSIAHVVSVGSKRVRAEFRPSVFAPYVHQTVIEEFPRESVDPIATPEERLIAGSLDDPERFELRQRAAHVIVGNRFGALSACRIDPMPHQMAVVQRVLSSPSRRFLIADEVGLGKTIEAGLIIHCLRQRGLARRFLLIVPAGLTIQWREEMLEKFGLQFRIYNLDVKGERAFDTGDLFIAPLETLRLNSTRATDGAPGHRTILERSRPWDFILFDEAHRLSATTTGRWTSDKTLAFRLAERQRNRSKALILMTGTPHRGERTRFENLVRLLDENVVFHTGPKKATDVPHTQVIIKNRKSAVTDRRGRPLFKGIQIIPVNTPLLDSGEKAFHEALESYLADGYGFAYGDGPGSGRKAIGLVMTTFQKLAASSTAAIKGALGKRGDALRSRQAGRRRKSTGIEDERFAAEHEFERAATDRRAFTDAEPARIQALVAMDVPEDGKLNCLFSAIDELTAGNAEEKLLIFTEYRKTQEYVVQELEGRYGEACATIIRGGLTLEAKLENVSLFRSDPGVRFLVSTEAGGEGINLQFCHLMINYDLPWNPFRLTQRYGRLYRYGQDREVRVFNFSCEDTIEAKVREYLEKKTDGAAKMLADLTGETPEDIKEGLLGTMERFVDYDKIYRTALMNKETKYWQTSVDRSVGKAQDAHRSEIAILEAVTAPTRPEAEAAPASAELESAHVEELVTRFLALRGYRSAYYEGCLQIRNPFGDDPDRRLQMKYPYVTFDREHAISNRRLDFMAVGHPFVDAVIRACGSSETGGFTASRKIMDFRYAGLEGIHFNFVVTRQRVTPDGQEVDFDLVPVVVGWDGRANEDAGVAALNAWKCDPIPEDVLRIDSDKLPGMLETALEIVRSKYPGNELLDENILCLNAAVTRFV